MGFPKLRRGLGRGAFGAWPALNRGRKGGVAWHGRTSGTLGTGAWLGVAQLGAGAARKGARTGTGGALGI